jgi:phage host-nuclease inhibitor protein Gam
LLEEQEMLAQDAEARLRAAEGRIIRLRRELEALETELGDRDARIQELSSQVEAFARDPEPITPNMLADERTSIISSAQQTPARMIERARAVSEQLQKAGEFERDRATASDVIEIPDQARAR